MNHTLAVQVDHIVLLFRICLVVNSLAVVHGVLMVLNNFLGLLYLLLCLLIGLFRRQIQQF